MTPSIAVNKPVQFTNDLISHCFSQGFQSLSKRDLELLIFYLLERDEAIPRQASNYEVARMLHLNVTRTKALRQDAYARWQVIDNVTRDQIIQKIFRDLLTKDRIEQAAASVSADDKASGFIALYIDHPADRVELEQEILNVGGIPKYERNPNVLLVLFDILWRIGARRNLLVEKAEIKRRFDQATGKKTTLEELLGKDITEIQAKDVREALNGVAIKLVSGAVEGVSVTSLLKAVFGF